jgi:hypothetical protein
MRVLFELGIAEDEERTIVLADAACDFDTVMDSYYASEETAIEATRQRCLRHLLQKTFCDLVHDKQQDALMGFSSTTVRNVRVLLDELLLPLFLSELREVRFMHEKYVLSSGALARHAADSDRLVREHEAAVSRARIELDESFARCSSGGDVIISAAERRAFIAVHADFLCIQHRLQAESLCGEACVEVYAGVVAFSSAAFTSLHLRAVRSALEQHKVLLRRVAIERDERLARWQISQLALVVQLPALFLSLAVVGKSKEDADPEAVGHRHTPSDDHQGATEGNAYRDRSNNIKMKKSIPAAEAAVVAVTERQAGAAAEPTQQEERGTDEPKEDRGEQRCVMKMIAQRPREAADLGHQRPPPSSPSAPPPRPPGLAEQLRLIAAEEFYHRRDEIALAERMCRLRLSCLCAMFPSSL